MLIPKYWAAATKTGTGKRGAVTFVRRGWSNESAAAAKAHAEARVAETVARYAAGEGLPTTERVTGYNGAEGLPICEEVLAQSGKAVVTRNVYGAKCLNTPNVVFADVDFEKRPERSLLLPATGVTVSAAVIAFALLPSAPAMVVALVALIGTPVLAYVMARVAIRLRGGDDSIAMSRIRAFAASHEMWGLRVYRTPRGFRVLVTHRTFEPSDPEVRNFFGALGVDPVYASMCLRQSCFRARVSPKPWRVGVSSRCPGYAPTIMSDRERSARKAWVDDYERKSTLFASCRFVEHLGPAMSVSDVTSVRVMHDELCLANTTLPLA